MTRMAELCGVWDWLPVLVGEAECQHLGVVAGSCDASVEEDGGAYYYCGMVGDCGRSDLSFEFYLLPFWIWDILGIILIEKLKGF